MSPPWALSPAAFSGLLAALHPDREQASLRCEERPTRLDRRLAEGEEVHNIPALLIGIARNLVEEEA